MVSTGSGVGIVGFGAYVARYRLKAETISRAWGGGPARGERAVANHDEDSLTMAVDASLRCVEGRDASGISGVLFASTTPPYDEKQISSIIATVLDLPREVFTADYAGSLRAGTSALLGAVNAVASGGAGEVLVAAADCRLARPGSQEEMALGDAAAALLIGREDPIAVVRRTYSISDEFTDVWRRRGEEYIRSGDQKFVDEYGLLRLVPEAVEGLLRKAGLKKNDVACVLSYAPNLRAHAALEKALGFPDGVFGGGDLLSKAGCSGAALPLLLTIHALQGAKPGDLLTVVGYGSGCDAILLEVTDSVKNADPSRGTAPMLDSGRVMDSYEKYMRFRDVVAGDKIVPYSSLALLWKERRSNIQLYGRRCLKCGAIQYPPRRVCWKCSAKDQFEDHKLSRKGRVFTFTKDHLVPSPDPPVIMAAADMDGGGRFYGQLTDCDPARVEIDMPVELCFRRMHEGEGFINYFWKFRPPIG